MEEPARKIGPYDLVSKIGQGTFGVVWLAERRASLSTTRVALKMPRNEDIDLETFRREADIWMQASGHTNVLPLIEAETYDGQVVIVSAYAPGGSLEAWRTHHGGRAPSVEAACEMMEGVLSGLAHLHKRRIIHRDLKPDNILLQEETPLLADFGISRVLRSSSHFTKNITGTFAYMAPEAFDGKRDEQTDIWAAGIIFYEMLAGRLPYDQQDTASLVGAIVRHDPPELPAGFVPEVLRRVVTKSLRRDPAERYRTAEEMRHDLREAGHQLWLERHEASRRVPETRLAGVVDRPLPPTPHALEALAPNPDEAEVAAPERRERARLKPFRVVPVSARRPATWLPVIVWCVVGDIAGLAATSLVKMSATDNEILGAAPLGGASLILGTALYLFGEYSSSPSIRKRGRVLSYIVLALVSGLGLYLSILVIVSVNAYLASILDFLAIPLAVGAAALIWSALIVTTEALLWRVALRRLVYALFIMVVAGLSGLIADCLFHAVVILATWDFLSALSLSFTLWMALLFAAHAIALGRNRNWLITTVTVVASLGLGLVTGRRCDSLTPPLPTRRDR